MRFITIIIFAVTGRLVALAIAKSVPNRKAGGIAIPLARQPSPLDSNKTIDLDAIASHGISVREKILWGLDNYKMNTGTIHPFAMEQSDSELELGRRGASVPLTPYQNKMWMCEISIGTPPKSLKVHIDTGSADMWVLQTGCDGISADRDSEIWDPESSESAQYERKTFRFQYSDGSTVEGYRYTDNVTIAGFTADPQTFGSAVSYTSGRLQGYEYPADGLLGLAFPSISKFGADPLFESLLGQEKLSNPTFSLKLSSSGAELYVGGTNDVLYSGDIAYIPVSRPGLWQVSMDGVRVNGDTILADVPVIFDSGATHIFGDWERVSELYGHLDATLREHGGFGFYYLPCDSFPALGFTFGDKTFEIPPEALTLRPISEGSPNCFSTIIAQRSRTAYWNIGLAFLQGVYSVFDYDNLRVGFADLT